MNIDTTKAMNYSWMSQASYLDLTQVIQGNPENLQNYLQLKGLNDDKVFAKDQADNFTNTTTGFIFISQLPNTGNGTSLSVFQSNADGSYTIAVRGTEPSLLDPSDLMADLLGVVGAGKAKVQLFEAFRYYKRITTAAGQTVTYSDTEVNAMANLLLSGTTLTGGLENITAAKHAFAMLTADDKGLGKLIPDGATINFAGHSLGGHVAYLLADLVSLTSGGNHPLGDVMTYNAPGENALLYEWQNWLGLDTSAHSGLIGSKHLAFYGEAGLNVTAGLGQVIGTRVPLFIEDSGVVTGNVAMENHSIVKLSDSLAVYNLLQKLDPTLTASAIESMLKASTATATDSLEQTLDIVRKIILGPGITPTKAMGSADSQTTRDAFYVNLYGLQDESAFKALAGQARIVPLAGMAAASLAAAGTNPDALATRYALKELNPFAVLGLDYSQHNQAGELDLYDPATGSGQLTESWLADRAGLLVALNQARTADLVATGGVFHVDPTGNANVRYTDVDAGLSVKVGQTTLDPQRIVFGGDSADAMTGGSQGDHLYGGGGNDTLRGLGGNDHLEGGTGDDTLEGGKGNDLLKGGAGHDTYVFQGGDGVDIIEDSDGQGHIEVNGQILTGGEPVGANAWQSKDGQWRYALIESGDLVISGTNTPGRIIVQGYAQQAQVHGEVLGLNLEQPPQQPPHPVETPDMYVAEGDDAKNLFDGSSLYPDFVQRLSRDADGQPVLVNTRAVTYGGLGGNDRLDGGYRADHDVLHGGSGDDSYVFRRGSGDDWVVESVNERFWRGAA